MNKSVIMKRAWAIAKEASQKFGYSSKEYFAISLRMAWAEAKEVKTMETKFTFDGFELPELEGTPKQVAWAMDIRAEVLKCVEYSLERTMESHLDNWYTRIASGNNQLLKEEMGMTSPNLQLLMNLVEDTFRPLDNGYMELEAFKKSLPLYHRSDTAHMTKEQKVEAGKEVVQKYCARMFEEVKGVLQTLTSASYWINSHKGIASFIPTFESYRSRQK